MEIIIICAFIGLLISLFIWINWSCRDQACPKCHRWLQPLKNGGQACTKCDNIPDDEWHDLRWLNMH